MNVFTKGRMNRPTYWLSLGIVVVIYALLIAFTTKPPAIAEVLMILLGVPRLHDIGRSGWWIALLFVFEIAAVGIGFMLLPLAMVMIVAGLVLFIMLIAMGILGCIPGDSGPNVFGEPPGPGVSFKWAGA